MLLDFHLNLQEKYKHKVISLSQNEFKLLKTMCTMVNGLQENNSPVTRFPLESVTEITVSVTGLPLASRKYSNIFVNTF